MKIMYQGFIYEMAISISDFTPSESDLVKEVFEYETPVEGCIEDKVTFPGLDIGLCWDNVGGGKLYVINLDKNKKYNTPDPDGIVGAIKFTKCSEFAVLQEHPNAKRIKFSYIVNELRGKGIMKFSYEYIINKYGAILSDEEMTNDSTGLYLSLAKNPKYILELYDSANKTIEPFDGNISSFFDKHYIRLLISLRP